jgi:hypothetical protein
LETAQVQPPINTDVIFGGLGNVIFQERTPQIRQ